MTLSSENKWLTEEEPRPEVWMAYVTNRWSRIIVQPLLITVLFTAFIAGPLYILQLVMPNTPWRFMTPVFFFLILETAYTTLWLKRPGQRALNHLAYRGAEFLIFLVLIRLLTWAITSTWPTLEQWESFLFEPFMLFYDGFFLVSAISVFVVWQMTIQMITLFSQLALDRAEAAYYADVFGKHKLDTRPKITDRGSLIAAFLNQWLIGGMILIFCAALSTFDVANPAASRSLFSIGRLALSQQMLLSLVLYFLAGFLLLSQGRLALMNARWLINGVEKNERLERSWYRFSLRLLGLVAFVAALLPLGSTIGLSRIVVAIIQVVTAVITFIVGLFIALLAFLFPASSQGSDMVPLQPVTPLEMPTPVPPGDAAETIQMIGSSAFWTAAIVLTILAFLFFLRERNLSATGRSWRQWWTAVQQWWHNLWHNLAGQIEAATQAIQSRRRQRPARKLPRLRPKRRLIRLNALSPREQLRYFYLSTVERAGRQGVRRQKSETPLEFAQDLKENWPDAEVDVESLTDAFLQARYSPQPIEIEQVNPIKAHWKKLRAQLRRRQRHQK